ncbi:MAG: 5-formyltetrahydrofolate cyclo-ligase [Simkaniaceae bacterium]|nr:5-formyltetrahydrofolate cyclo-ligase [Simkaniaceae bacterium]MCF7852139.1 5-formyltetrahydrofolate cyclo-ligase [Simkaniaceae bacterium]
MKNNIDIRTKKIELRKTFNAIRDQLSVERRLQGSFECGAFLKEKLKNNRYVASYGSRLTELNLWDLNLTLCAWGKLVLPRVFDAHFEFYHVEDIEKDLIRSAFQILEPNPARCKKADMSLIDTILVPGLAFDKKGFRLGYGLGYYDQQLAMLDEKLKIGVCFKEQLIDQLPNEPHDVPVDKVFSF